jgi:putative ubiquitin-RnfH superfamily antitoxin RatB of RatAB toxin-antitoxin module
MLQVTVTCSPVPREVFEQIVKVPEGASVRDAVMASDLTQAYPAFDWQAAAPGIWGRAVEWTQAVAEMDRIELCRPLAVDPKVARRERFKQQGARGTGLFARRRQGGKAGY